MAHTDYLMSIASFFFALGITVKAWSICWNYVGRNLEPVGPITDEEWWAAGVTPRAYDPAYVAWLEAQCDVSPSVDSDSL